MEEFYEIIWMFPTLLLLKDVFYCSSVFLSSFDTFWHTALTLTYTYTAKLVLLNNVHVWHNENQFCHQVLFQVTSNPEEKRWYCHLKIEKEQLDVFLCVYQNNEFK